MKYTCKVDIDLPIDKTVALWEDETKFKEWQDGFKSIELISGTPNSEGAKSKIILEEKRKIELLETILISDLPNKKIALYEHIHMTNTQTTSFKSINQNKTQYISEVEYTKFNGILVRLVAKLFPSKFKEQSLKWMNQFKEFAEKSNDL